MKALKRCFTFLLCVVTMLSFSMTAHATELIQKTASVRVVITDESTGNTAESVTVEFYDVKDGSMAFTDIYKTQGWEGMITLPVDHTYSVIVRGLDNEFMVVDTFGDREKPISQLTYKVGEIANTLYWSIMGTAEVPVTGTGTGANTDAAQDVPSTFNGMSATEAYEAFLEAVSFIENDSTWSSGFAATLNQYGKDSINANLYSKWYADYVQGGSAEEYFALTPFEQFLWTETYTRLAYASYGSGDYNKYYGSDTAFNRYIVNIAKSTMAGNNSDAVIKAYENLMAWQYNYIVTESNGVPYCFITDRSSKEEIKDVPVVVPDGDETLSEDDKQGMQEVIDELEKDENGEEEEKGIWTDTFDLLAKHFLTILLLVAFGVALLVVVHIRKKKNIDNK